jgi:radical SAM superfamily enzyme YgiQ (UPF0313 family)
MNGFINEKNPTFNTIISNQTNSRVALISFGGTAYNHSIRSIAAYLRAQKYNVSIIQCLPEGKDNIFSLLNKIQLEQLKKHCEGMLAIGISVLTTHYLNRAIQINNYIKEKLNIPVIWGGVPVICDPEFYLQYCDYVCTGEGEYFLSDFLQNIISGNNILKTKGLAYKKEGGGIIRNGTLPSLDVNEIPLPLFDLKNHYYLKERLVSLEEDPSPLISQTSSRGYRVFSIRGCPFKCTYCSNNKLSQVFEGQKILRKRRNDLIVEEIIESRKIIPDITKIWFEEDDFFSRTDEDLDELARIYKKHVGLPISIFATIKRLKDNRLDILKDNNIEIERIKIGLQSASKRVNREVYKRPFNAEEYITKLTMLSKRKISVLVDVISDNPYETKEDKIETINFYIKLLESLKNVKNVHKYMTYLDHKLMFYPGTELYYHAMNDGFIPKDYISKVLLVTTTANRNSKTIDIDKVILALFRISLKHKKIVLIMKLMKKKLVLDLINNEVIKKGLFLALRLRNVLQNLVSIS